MDWLRNVSLTILLCLVGAVFMYLGFAGTLSVWKLNLGIGDLAYRLAAIAAGVILVGGAVWLEVRIRSATTPPPQGPADDQGTWSTDNVFYSLDDPSAPQLADRLDGAKRISLLARSGVSIFAQYESLFIELGKSGCEFRVILVDPDSLVAPSIYGGDDESFETYVNAAFNNLNRMQEVLGKALSVRLIQYAPTISLLIVEHYKTRDDNMQVTFLFTHTLFGRDRPNFTLNKNDRWYSAFLGEFKKAWEAGADWRNG